VLFPARSDFGSCLLGRILASPRSQPTFKGDPGSEAVLHLRTIPAAYSTREPIFVAACPFVLSWVSARVQRIATKPAGWLGLGDSMYTNAKGETI